MTLHIHVIFHNPHSAHLTPRTPLSWMLAVLPRALGSQQQACLVVETPIHPQGLTAADIPVSWPWACVPAMTMCEGKLVKKCSCTGVCSAALLKGCSGARSCLWVVEHTNMLLLICFFPNNCISVEIMWSKLRKWQDAYPDEQVFIGYWVLILWLEVKSWLTLPGYLQHWCKSFLALLWRNEKYQVPYEYKNHPEKQPSSR